LRAGAAEVQSQIAGARIETGTVSDRSQQDADANASPGAVQHGLGALKIEAGSKPKYRTLSKPNRSKRDLPSVHSGPAARCPEALSRRGRASKELHSERVVDGGQSRMRGVYPKDFPGTQKINPHDTKPQGVDVPKALRAPHVGLDRCVLESLLFGLIGF